MKRARWPRRRRKCNSHTAGPGGHDARSIATSDSSWWSARPGGGCATHGQHGQTPATSSGISATAAAPQPTKASGKLILATTTSTQDSGLLDVLVPAFEKETGYTVQTVAVGSGQAIAQASRGDADVVLVHSPDAEKMMIDAGDGIERTLVMHNDFILVGP